MPKLDYGGNIILDKENMRIVRLLKVNKGLKTMNDVVRYLIQKSNEKV